MLAILVVYSAESTVDAREIHGEVNMGIQDINKKANKADFTRKDELAAERDKYKSDSTNAFEREGLREQGDKDKLENLKENSPLWQERRGDTAIIIAAVCVGVIFLLIIICCCRRKYLRKKAE